MREAPEWNTAARGWRRFPRGAIGNERAFTRDAVRLPQLGIEFVGSRGEAFLLGFEFMDRARLALFHGAAFLATGFQGGPLRYQGVRRGTGGMD